MKHTRVLALLLSAAMLLVLLASTAFVVSHADHDCCGDNCLICEQINVCTQHLKTVSLAAAAELLFAAFLRFARASLPTPAPSMARQTLITCKVKLTN